MKSTVIECGTDVRITDVGTWLPGDESDPRCADPRVKMDFRFGGFRRSSWRTFSSLEMAIARACVPEFAGLGF